MKLKIKKNVGLALVKQKRFGKGIEAAKAVVTVLKNGPKKI